MLVFIPTTYYGTSAAAAETYDDLFAGQLDAGYIVIGDAKTAALRVGNRGTETVQVVLSVIDEGGEVIPDFTYQVEPDAFTLAPDAVSDTVSIRIATPYIDRTVAYSVELVATPDVGDEAALRVIYEVVGPLANRISQYPRRRSDATDNFTGIIETLGDDVLVRWYEPLAYDGGSVQVYASESRRDLTGDAANTRFVSPCDPCERLNPFNGNIGYAAYHQPMVCQFQRENRSTTTHVLADNSTLTYQVSASLIVAAPWESLLYRNWALFACGREADRPQYKRTVILIQRLDELFAVENVRTLDGPNQAISHFECDLVQLHRRTAGSPDSFNPFAITYEYQSDKPYAVYPCDIDPVALTLDIEDPYADPYHC